MDRLTFMALDPYNRPMSTQRRKTPSVRENRVIVSRAAYARNPLRYARKAKSDHYVVIHDAEGKVSMVFGGDLNRETGPEEAL